MKLLLFSSFAFISVMADDEHHDKFQTSMRSFSAKLYKELADSSAGNFLVCPFSSEIVLALVLNGARDETKDQISQVLSLPSDLPTVNQMVKSVLPKTENAVAYTLKSVNKMFVNNDTTIKSNFAKTADEIFKSTVGIVNFKNKQASVDQINTWAAENTDNNIKNLLTTQDIQDQTKAILLNALYFQATWAKRFHEEKTTQKSFYSSPTISGLVDMMEQTGTFEYDDHPDAQFLKMSYLGTDIAMIVALPKEKNGLTKLEDQIENVFKVQNLNYKKVHVVFPKFTMNRKIKMKPILEKLGIVDLFTPTANLANLSDQPLHVSEIIQQNYIEINEKGTIAASATAALAGLGAGYNPEEPVDFIADHPFIYYIWSPSGIMFVGRYYGPQ